MYYRTTPYTSCIDFSMVYHRQDMHLGPGPTIDFNDQLTSLRLTWMINFRIKVTVNCGYNTSTFSSLWNQSKLQTHSPLFQLLYEGTIRSLDPHCHPHECHQ